MKTVQVQISGAVVGPIWMPSVECTKDVKRVFRLVPPEQNIRSADEIDCLRDALLKITNDGDFQSCSLERWSTLSVTKLRSNGYVITRHWQLRGTGENADCFC
jgi:hypothetical protein